VTTLTLLFSTGIQQSAELENELVSVERLREYEELEHEASSHTLEGKIPNSIYNIVVPNM
jgi:hypothetical protein